MSNIRAENEKMAIKVQTDDLKAACDHLLGEKVKDNPFLCAEIFHSLSTTV